jgi:hypothetical protein
VGQQCVSKENDKAALVPCFIDVVSKRTAGSVVLIVQHHAGNPATDSSIDRHPVVLMNNNIGNKALLCSTVPFVHGYPARFNQ